MLHEICKEIFLRDENIIVYFCAFCNVLYHHIQHNLIEMEREVLLLPFPNGLTLVMQAVDKQNGMRMRWGIEVSCNKVLKLAMTERVPEFGVAVAKFMLGLSNMEKANACKSPA